MEKGNVNKHRYSREGVGSVVEESKWGHAKARERYNSLKFENGAPRPPDRSQPQDPVDKHGASYSNDVDANSWVRGGGSKGAEGKPNFQAGIRRPGKA
jgi:hypothetical protein